MEKNNTEQPSENMTVAKFDPALTYAGASMLQLSESEAKNLAAPFVDSDYEIRPDGFIYLPQAIALKRLNEVLGIGRWALLNINAWKQELGVNQAKVFYDGALVVRGSFVARSVGEAQYNLDNKNQSWASALESAKSDCRQRCCKDLGIANDAWTPSFVRRWQKDNAVRVFVKRDGATKNDIVWRRKDVDPFWNEVSEVPAGFRMESQPGRENNTDKPWLNSGPAYNEALAEILEGRLTIEKLSESYRISKETRGNLNEAVINHLGPTIDDQKDLASLTRLYNKYKPLVDTFDALRALFNARRDKVKTPVK